MAELCLLLSELMRAQGITQPGELSIQLTGAEYWVHRRDTVRAPMSGKVERGDPAFRRGVAQVLGLNEEEKTNLVRNVLFGHVRPTGREEWTKPPLVRLMLARIYPKEHSVP